jgi:hypothetical protein
MRWSYQQNGTNWALFVSFLFHNGALGTFVFYFLMVVLLAREDVAPRYRRLSFMDPQMKSEGGTIG